MKGILDRFTEAIPLAILTGTVVTTLLDSSSSMVSRQKERG
ncbi:hypothetical protein [Hymenobacter antarcticus]